MSMIMRPFQEFQNAKHLIVLWLNSDEPLREVPESWCTIWNKSSYRYCTDGAANLLRELCKTERTVPPTTISGDLDSIEQESLDYFEKTSIIQRTPDQDYTDLTKALKLIGETDAVNNGEVKNILILGGLNGRFDHTLGTLNSVHNFIAEKSLPIYVIDGTNFVTILPTVSTEIYLERERLTGKCGLLPLCQRETRVTTKGFKWDLNDQKMEYGGLISSCNEIDADCLKIQTNTPIVFTCELLSPESLLK